MNGLGWEFEATMKDLGWDPESMTETGGDQESILRSPG